MGVGAALATAFASCLGGAIVGAIVPARRVPVVTAIFGAIGAIAGIAASIAVLATDAHLHYPLWSVEPGEPLAFSIDRLSALFLLPGSVVMLASSVYSASYLQRHVGRYDLRVLNAWFLLLFASIAAVLLAADVLVFLLAWEAMSVTSYLLVAFENRRTASSGAAYLMLAMGEAGFIATAAVLASLALHAGSPALAAATSGAAALSDEARWILFLLAFFGFGVKAGLVPFNSWLPRAHPAAPANVSAMLSGAILNLGLYGIVRIALPLAPATSAAPGLLVLVVGTLSALIGILYATTESDIKALLAHSSIENIGVIVVGLGSGMVFLHYARPSLAAMAFVAAFYHMLNHSAYKSLLFLGAGAVDDRAGTRDLNRLGGLIRAMPWTSAAMLVGALSIAALPPFNGFTSEWLTLQVLLRAAELKPTSTRLVFVLCGAGLALAAALAVTCFVKMFAMGFLGMARSEGASHAKEARPSSIAPMIGLAIACLALGVLPTYIIGGLGESLRPLAEGGTDALVPPFFSAAPGHDALAPSFAAEFHDLGAQVGDGWLPGRGLVVLHRGAAENPVVFAMSMSYALVVLVALLAIVFVLARGVFARGRRVDRRERWAGGVRRLLPEMTYTATGFSNPVRVIFDAIFRPTTVVDAQETIAEHFRNAIRREKEHIHVVDRMVFLPVARAAMRLAHRLAEMHHGKINAYAAYVLEALALALVAGLL